MRDFARKALVVVAGVTFGVVSFCLASVTVLVGSIPMFSGAVDGKEVNPEYLLVLVAVGLFLSFMTCLLYFFLAKWPYTFKKRTVLGAGALVFASQVAVYLYA